MQDYKKQQNIWLKEDNELFSKKFSITSNLNQFQCADFEVEENENLLLIKKSYDWNPIDKKYSNTDKDNKEEMNKDNNDENKEIKSENDYNHNIILKNKIISLDEDCLAIRSFGLEINLSILMSGESNFYIFTRCKSEGLDECTTVCCISKELKSARKFIAFAILEKDGDEKFIIKNLKKQEIPHQTHHIEDLDLSELSFTFLDNGDNRCFVYLKEEIQNSNMQLMGNFYEPIKDKCNIMLACSGDLISSKELEIRHIQRDLYINERNNNNVNVQCCEIF